MYRILAINPGSTSTKIALFDDEKMVFKENLTHEADKLAQFKEISEQLPYRTEMVIEALNKNNIPLNILKTPVHPFSFFQRTQCIIMQNFFFIFILFQIVRIDNIKHDQNRELR